MYHKLLSLIDWLFFVGLDQQLLEKSSNFNGSCTFSLKLVTEENSIHLLDGEVCEENRAMWSASFSLGQPGSLRLCRRSLSCIGLHRALLGFNWIPPSLTVCLTDWRKRQGPVTPAECFLTLYWTE